MTFPLVKKNPIPINRLIGNEIHDLFFFFFAFSIFTFFNVRIFFSINVYDLNFPRNFVFGLIDLLD